MKTLEEVVESKKVMVIQRSHDGWSGIIYIRGWQGTVQVSWGAGWDHVSVAPRKHGYTPSWDDMCAIKDLFFREDEAVIQIHPPKSEYVNNMPNCLHLWRRNDAEMSLPPSFMIGVRKGQTPEEAIAEAKKYYLENGYQW